MKKRLDQAMVEKKLVASRSQAESFIKLGEVEVNHKSITKPGFLVAEADNIKLKATQQYVSRAGLKLASVAETLKLDFNNKIMLDVGSSTGGFTDYALQHGIKKVIAVDVGTDQLHPSLRGNPQIELYEKTDIRQLCLRHTEFISGARRQVRRDSIYTNGMPKRVRHDDFIEIAVPDIVVIDVSFISLREILPTVFNLSSSQTQIIAMVKPQFEAGNSSVKHKGVIKNDAMRRQILKDFEQWLQTRAVVVDKADSKVAGSKGNLERFYLLKKVLR